MLIKVIFFDLDGTLAESTASLYGVYSEFLSLFDIVGTQNEFDELNGKNIEQIVTLLKKRYGLMENTDELIEKYQDAVSRVYAHTEAAPGAGELLHTLASEGYVLGLVTSASRALAESFVKQQNWEKLFSIYAYGDEVSNTKPHPEIYLKAIILSGEIPEEILVVEDSSHGVTAATAAGLRTIGLAHDDMSEELRTAGADITVAALSAIPEVLSVWRAEQYRVIAVGDISLTVMPPTAEFEEKQSAGEARIETVWNTLSLTRPLFNGTVLNTSTIAYDGEHIKISAHNISYKDFLAERHDPSLKFGIRSIGVSGILLVQDAQKLVYVVFASRKMTVTQWPGRLELVPSGSIDARHVDSFGTVSYKKQILEELAEEVGINEKDVKTATGFALVYDARERVYDICCVVEVSLQKEDLERMFKDSMEYERPVYVLYEDLPQFISKHKEEIVPTSLALLSAYQASLLQ